MAITNKRWFNVFVMWYLPVLTAALGYSSPVGWRLPLAVLLLIYAIVIATGHGDWMLIAYTRSGLKRKQRKEERSMVRRKPLRTAMCAWNIIIASVLAASSFVAIPTGVLIAVFAAVSAGCVALANK